MVDHSILSNDSPDFDPEDLSTSSKLFMNYGMLVKIVFEFPFSSHILRLEILL
jgi:hypothetical protein